jgi:hypothetical protein
MIRYRVITTNIRQPSTDEYLNDIQPLIMNSSFVSGPRQFTEHDIACVRAPGNIGTQWTISLSSLENLKVELLDFLNRTNASQPRIYFDYSLMRKREINEQGVLSSDYNIMLSRTHNSSLSKSNAHILWRMLSSDNQSEVIRIHMNNIVSTFVCEYFQASIQIQNFLPKFIHLLPDMIDMKSTNYEQDIQMTLRRHRHVLWWDIAEIAHDIWKHKCSFDSKSLNLITISERAGAQSKSFNLIAKLLIGWCKPSNSSLLFTMDFYSSLGSNAKLTLIGVYAGLVYVIWLTCFRQALFSDIQMIMYHEWPFADRMEKLCEEVYLVRELGELELEEELFARLLFLHRSPETLVRFTQPKIRAQQQQQQHLHQH